MEKSIVRKLEYHQEREKIVRYDAIYKDRITKAGKLNRLIYQTEQLLLRLERARLNPTCSARKEEVSARIVDLELSRILLIIDRDQKRREAKARKDFLLHEPVVELSDSESD